ncbi:riboflavin biosynthesis protein RibD [candidate division WOR-1 bacterium RIFOXYB2_FULL_42_35]|uniref:Riboflavin biosynthesis protein RibD n=1 Tax=candidate division WOR-1 bacterium RIFOXYC2_FULL_41_25 TaxID=1802586 RepID=A0A1F4TNT4_UNCSA|nr:MAG: riboflavin biosynthesis protein RibD [candidate division WOR-1 bacterium RIFOXYA2_FULL_41_14]OGC24685.1 MAG: riboflavin biosynthesis protein RibD [candidate division WOR-1 bacterium RIFOXYB2_FULL_42_35]OGC34200.1 MAG: riboflavin biosynthesis protein RibD [candidate division WOR-1 bacterium RIFOXYC2_FULL_41_25]OGC41394.1 MAG: riboflavin biosynthesis protein RibD [candidate division WOR-1 bacterium RIFOXYD2_FULL_41_8]
MWSTADKKFMREALLLAKATEGRTTPDPMVGAVLVKDGRIIARGYHSEVKTAHAEAWAIQKAGQQAKGAILYINLEPCSHYGNNPPCADLVVRAGIKEVVAAMRDPNPLVNGQGFKILQNKKVKLRVGLLEAEAKKLNEVFIKHITTQKPFVVVKVVTTLDGKIATKTGASRWVSGPETLKFAHHLRNVYDAILVGVGTVLIDNPTLTTRLVKKIKHPIRIVLDALAKTPLTAKVVTNKETRTIIVVGPKAAKKKIEALKKNGVEMLKVKASKGRINLPALMKKLAKMKITSVLVEGGGEVIASALQAKVVDKMHCIIAPKIFGGRTAKTSVEGEGIKSPEQAWQLNNVKVERLGEDILVTGYLR